MGYDKEGWERGALPAFRKGGTHENRPFDRHFIHPAAEGYRHRTGTGGTIRSAIDGCRELQFLYYAPKGESWRIIEPYYLIFRWSSWYVWGWCRMRKDFRLFKLNRMEELRLSESTFTKRPVPLPDLSNERIFPGGIHVKALFDAGCKWRLVEEFGAACFQEQPDGRLLFSADYTDEENLLTWLLSFRDRVELLEPEELREKIRMELERTLERYTRKRRG